MQCVVVIPALAEYAAASKTPQQANGKRITGKGGLRPNSAIGQYQSTESAERVYFGFQEEERKADFNDDNQFKKDQSENPRFFNGDFLAFQRNC